jgi:uncharacterized DUF497 family protein
LIFAFIGGTITALRITYHPAKRDATLQNRGLDFEDASEIFAGVHFTAADDRFDYGEPRFISAGFLRGRMVVLVWTPRNDARHMISMRYCHADEEEYWRERMDRPG